MSYNKKHILDGVEPCKIPEQGMSSKMYLTVIWILLIGLLIASTIAIFKC